MEQQTPKVLAKHARLTLASAAQRPALAEAIGEIVFAGKAEWTHAEVVAVWREIDASTVPVGVWVGQMTGGAR